MAVDTNSLAYLIDPFWQGEGINGKPLVAGYMCVYIAGTDQKYITWQNWDGTRHPFKIPLGSDGRATILVEVQYTYDCYLYDSFGNLVCSRLNVKPAIGGDVTVYGLTEVWHDGTMSGEGTPQSPLSVVSAGKVYDGIEPIVVNNIENKISAQHIPLGVQDPLYFVEDSETACIIGFSGQTVPEGVMTESALGFENNKITGYNGSAFSAGNEYEAGSYIDITDNTISVVNLPTSADVQNIVDVATSGLMPSGNYLTKESADTLYAPTGNYLTGLPDDLVYTADITGLATTAELDEKLDKSDSGNFYPMEGNPSGFLTAHQSLQGYATEQWVEDKGYLTSVDIPESAVWNATTQTVSANSAQWAGGTANPQIPVTSTSGISIFESGDKVYFNISADYAFTSDLQNVSAEITGMIPAPFDPTYLSGQIDTKLNSAIYAEDSGKFLTALPSDLVYTADIQDMATTGDLTSKQDITGMTAYATVESLTAKQDAGDYLSASDSANFLLTSDSGNFYPMNENPSGYLTAHQSLTDYQTTADMVNYQTTAGMTAYQEAGDYYSASNPSGFISEVPDTYLQNTDLSTEDGKVTAISGIPLSAGGDVPEGVMVESGLEYNAVQEISGYNGSAIAQYGAEKQWLVHDDTLVHASNSAQYALGCNISALQRLMGIDETILYNNTAATTADVAIGSTFNISEPITNFNKFKIYFSRFSVTSTGAADSGPCAQIREYDSTACSAYFVINETFPTSTVQNPDWFDISMLIETRSGTTWKCKACYQSKLPSGSLDRGWTYLKPYKVIGIGRKQ